MIGSSQDAAARTIEGQAKHQFKHQFKPLARPLTDNRQVQAGVILAASLLGWVAMRRKSQKQQLDF